LIGDWLASEVHGQVASRQVQSGIVTPWDPIIGAWEMVAALVALTLLSIVVKAAFEQYGENAGEQIFMQHLCSLPLFFLGGQWRLIEPRLHAWAFGGDYSRVVFLVANIALTFGNRAASVRMAGRAPNLLLVQLVETVVKFLSLLLTALMNAPPLPPNAFWLGALVLVSGTVQFLCAPDVKPPSAGGENELDASKVKRDVIFERDNNDFPYSALGG